MKKYLSIITLVSAIFLLAGCGKPTTNIENNITNNNNNREEITNTEINECKQGCNIMTQNTEDKEYCYVLCEINQKLNSNDINDCEDIEKISGGLITRDICIQGKASQAQNPDFCEKVENSMNRDACYMGLADELDDQSLCNKIKDSMLKTMCEEQEY